MRRGRVPELGIILLGLQLVRNIGVTNIPPVTCLAILGQVGVYLQMLVVPRLCLSGEGVWVKGEYLRLVVPALRHTHDIHLYYNMVSLAWKGIQLERRLGSIRFFFTLVLLTLMSGIAYVLLAVLAADLSEDYSYMQQCSIGFSGVLFALKVLTSQYSSETDRESYFGFLVPIRYGVWLELLLIQVLVPNTSFIGHLGGILAGLVLVKGPIGGISSIFRSYSMVPFGPGCLLLCLGLVTQYTGYFNGHPLTGCLPTRDLFYQSWAQPSLQGAKYIILSPLYHLGILHLVINLASLLIKGRRLEAKFGTFGFLRIAAFSLFGTTFMYWVVNRLVYEFTGSWDHLSDCVVGLSGPLFAFKILVLLHSSRLDSTVVYELVELLVLLEKNTMLYHISGILVGGLIYLWWTNENISWRTDGVRLGGDATWTRSWGYTQGTHYTPGHTGYTGYTAGYDNIQENTESYNYSYFQNEGSEWEEGPAPSAPRYEDLVGTRPPLYPDNPGPPPTGRGFILRSDEGLDELRRRRLERFS